MEPIMKLKIFGEHEQNTLDQMNEVCKDERVSHAVLCADGHIGYSVPIGGVLAYENSINITGVGFDIACGNKAVLLDCDPNEIKNNIYRNMNEIQKHISFGVGRKNNETVDHELFDDPMWNELELLRNLKDKARSQLGTVGSGNHYVDVFVDETSRIWVGVHFGSRGMGHTIATHFIKAGGGIDGVHSKSVIFDESSELGQEYLKCMDLAGRYAYAGRDWVCKRVAQILRGNITDEVHNHHNFAWRERHFGKDLWVIRKGATPAFPGQRGFVGGSMGDISVILEGMDSRIENEHARNSLYSTVHGAGRRMGRNQAKGKNCRKTGKILSPGLISQEAHDAWIKRVGVEIRGGGLDESPIAYKRINEVLNAHEGTIKILHTLTPIGVAMADERDKDPYKD